jgi:hypothetical protein
MTSNLTLLLAQMRQEEILREARAARIELGPFQDEEEEILALERDRQLREEKALEAFADPDPWGQAA